MAAGKGQEGYGSPVFFAIIWVGALSGVSAAIRNVDQAIDEGVWVADVVLLCYTDEACPEITGAANLNHIVCLMCL